MKADLNVIIIQGCTTDNTVLLLTSDYECELELKIHVCKKKASRITARFSFVCDITSKPISIATVATRV